MTCKNGSDEFRPDITPLINGLPLAFIEVKKPNNKGGIKAEYDRKFCGKRPFLTRLIQQINFTYGHNCYDACAVLMRRLFEVLLVLAYQNKGI